MKIRFLLLAAMTAILFPRALSAQVLIKSAGFENGAVGDWGFTADPGAYFLPDGDSSQVWGPAEEVGYEDGPFLTTLGAGTGEQFWAMQNLAPNSLGNSLFFEGVDLSGYEDVFVRFDFAASGFVDSLDALYFSYFDPFELAFNGDIIFIGQGGSDTGTTVNGPFTAVDWQTFTWQVPGHIEFLSFGLHALFLNDLVDRERTLAGFDQVELWGTAVEPPVIPEPATLAWGALVLLGGWLAWRRRG